MRPLSAAAEAGNLSLVQGPWIAAFLDEAELVPHGSHDDQIDAAAGAHQQLTTARAVMQIRPIAL
jgi:phage terminase large subunit-like protein